MSSFLNYPEYANDIYLIFDRVIDIDQMEKEGSRIRLNINVNTTKVPRQMVALFLLLYWVEHFVFLGSVISGNGVH